MHTDLSIALAAHEHARRRRGRARHETHDPRRPPGRALREAVGYRLVVTGWRLLDPVAGGVPSAQRAHRQHGLPA